jgi:REP element-mobilizing transposase RayT
MERFFRRDLAHWPVEGTSTTYFVTWRLARGQRDLVSSDRSLVASVLKHWDGARCNLSAWVVMNDHVHVVVTPTAHVRLEKLIHSWKSYSAGQMVRAYGRSGPVWQRGVSDQAIRDEMEWMRTVMYVSGNPWRRWPSLAEYPWVYPQPLSACRSA